MPMTRASKIKTMMIWFRDAPTARIIPMSFVRSWTDAIIVFTTPKIPINKVIPASASIILFTFCTMSISVLAICLTAVALIPGTPELSCAAIVSTGQPLQSARISIEEIKPALL